MSERSIFLSALEIDDADARQAFLNQACADNPQLRQEIEALLQSHDQAGSFLETPAAKQVALPVLPTVVGQLPKTETADDLGFLTPSDAPGSLGRLGHYEVKEVLGRGAFGIVLKAFDDMLHRMVAIKVMNPELAATSPPRKRFLREARSSAAVRHENIVSIHAVEEQPIPYLVMEYIPGMTLQQRLDQNGPLDAAEVARIGQQIASGLAAAHAQGLIHRDIKPANILIESGLDERAKITDFGLARAADDASLTQSGLIAGTPMYMAPEQARGETLDHRADLFSLGSVLYVMASGRPPFRAPTTIAVLKRVCEDTPRPIEEVIPGTPPWLCGVIARLHAKDPADRFQSAKEVADVLGQCQAHYEAPHQVPAPDPMPFKASAPRRLSSEDEAILKTLRGPAKGLLWTAMINWIVLIGSLLFVIWLLAGSDGHFGLGVAEMILIPVWALGSGFILAGSLRMQRGESYGFCVLASVGAMLIGPGYFIGWPIGIWSLIVLTQPDVRAFFQKRAGVVRPAIAPARPRGVIGQAWHEWWSERDRWFTTSVQAVLIVVYLACMLLFVSVGASTGRNEQGNATFTYRMGAPDPWFLFEVYPEPLTPFRFGFHIFVNSVLIGLVGCAAYYGYWRIEKVRNPQTSSWYRPEYMLGVWGLGALIGVVVGQWMGYAVLERPRVTVSIEAQKSTDRAMPPQPRDLGPWQRAVQLARQERDQARKLHEAGSISSTEVTEADIRLSEAELKLAEETEDWEQADRHYAALMDQHRRLYETARKRFEAGHITQSEVTKVEQALQAVQMRRSKLRDTYPQIPPADMATERLRQELELVVDVGRNGLSDQRRAALEQQGHALLELLKQPTSQSAIQLLAGLPDDAHERLLRDGYLKWPSATLDESRRLQLEVMVRQLLDLAKEMGFGVPDSHGNLTGQLLKSSDTGFAVLDEDDGTQVIAWYVLLPVSPVPLALPIVYSEPRTSGRDREAAADRHFDALRALRSRANSPLPPPYTPPFAVAPFDAATAQSHQAAWAAHLGAPVEFTNSLGMTFRLIPPGEFLMGNTDEEIRALSRALEQSGANDFDKFVAQFSGPQHKVRITQPFYCGTHEVTVGQYRRFVEETKYLSTMQQLGVKRFEWTASVAEPNPEQRAVIGVSWDDAQAFCRWLSEREGVACSLPSEAQWEYACRAGTTTLWSFGNDAAQLDEYAVFGREAFWPAEVVGSRRPNPFGLYDMHGNADEWCLDWHESSYYAKSPVDDPVCLSNPQDKNSGRVARGGTSHSSSWWTRSTTRPWDFPATPNTPKGFRVMISGPLSRLADQAAADTAPDEPVSALMPQNAVETDQARPQ